MSENQSGNREVYEICLEAFAGISAIMTHETRNILAIINESAGFLEDLVLMAGEDGAVPVKNVGSMSVNIVTQVSRANSLMKDYNTFAHSGDETYGEVELYDLMTLVVTLIRRKAAQKSIKVVVGEGGERLYTKPFVLESLVYFCLIKMYEDAASESTIETEICGDGEGVTLRFSCAGGQQVVEEICAMDKVKILAASVGASCRHEGNSLSIHLLPCR